MEHLDRLTLLTLPGITPASPLQPIEGRGHAAKRHQGLMAIRVYGDNLDGWLSGPQCGRASAADPAGKRGHGQP